jgi:PKD repeat protein
MKISRIIITICLYPLFSFILHAQIIGFKGEPTEICAGQQVLFTDTSSGFSGAATYAWEFGADAVPAIANTKGPHNVTYNAAGGKNVKLTIVEGSTYIDNKPNYITVYSNPAASITPDPAVTCEGVGLSLDGNPSGGSGTYTTHLWTGAGATYLDNVNSQTPTFTCGTSGNYSLTYTVTDDNGCSGSDDITVTVYSNPSASIIPDPAWFVIRWKSFWWFRDLYNAFLDWCRSSLSE